MAIGGKLDGHGPKSKITTGGHFVQNNTNIIYNDPEDDNPKTCNPIGFIYGIYINIGERIAVKQDVFGPESKMAVSIVVLFYSMLCL